MCASACVCPCVHVCIGACVCMCALVHVCSCVCMHVCICVYTHAYMCAHVCASVCACGHEHVGGVHMCLLLCVKDKMLTNYTDYTKDVTWPHLIQVT